MPQPPARVRFFPKGYNVLLIEPPNSLSVGFNATVVVEPLGLQYVAGAISDIAQVRIYDMRVDPTPLSAVMKEFKPSLVGIRENYTVDVAAVSDVARQVKSIDPDVPVVIGGHHVSLSPQDAFIPQVDAVVIGEGERPFRDLVISLQESGRLDNVPHVIFRERGGVFNDRNVPAIAKTSLKEFESARMDQRPVPARSLVDQYRPDYFFLYHERPYSIEMARGCIYRCNFCSVHEFHQGAYRVQGNERTLRELSSLPKGSWVNVVDDLAIQEIPASQRKYFPAGYDPMEKLAEDVEALNMGHRYWMQVRADNVVRNPEKFEKWARAGLDTVLIGLESFDQKDLNAVSKGSKSDDNERAIEILHSFGIRIWGAILVFQNWADANFEHLKAKVMEHAIEFPQFTILTPLPGTLQWKETEHRLLAREGHFFDFLHSVLPTNLDPRRFYEQYSSLWRTVGGGGMDRARKMLREVSTTRLSVRRFLKQYGTLSDIDTYSTGIELLERGRRVAAGY